MQVKTNLARRLNPSRFRLAAIESKLLVAQQQMEKTDAELVETARNTEVLPLRPQNESCAVLHALNFNITMYKARNPCQPCDLEM